MDSYGQLWTAMGEIVYIALTLQQPRAMESYGELRTAMGKLLKAALTHQQSRAMESYGELWVNDYVQH